MSQKKVLLTAIKLHDGTVMICNEAKKTSDGWIVSKFRYQKEDEISKSINEPMIIHDDAIEVFFKLLKGGKPEKKKKKPVGPYAPKPSV